MKKGFRKNQKGSVLLAVVCMTMVCMTLATISLSVVNYTTQSSNRNVRRSQAKITAEACLTEFVDAYKTVDGKYDDLLTLALGNSRETAREIDVQMDGDASFDSEFGDCTLYVYKQGTGFRVDSVCNYAGQEQTASIHFVAKKDAPYVPSSALEAGAGAAIVDGVATPVAGGTYIEKADTVTTNSIHTSNDATYEGHVFSEYNLYMNSNSKVIDGVNKTLTTNYVHDDPYFRQASTITVTGYITFDNGCSFTTDVGKTDVNGKNSDVDGYDPSKLSNKDGYIYTFKKFLGTYANGYTIGSTGRPIDVYSHGAYFGWIPDYIDGSITEKDEIREAFDGSEPIQQMGDPKITGNFYSYVGSGSEMKTNGDVVINIGSGHTVTIDGDMFVEGDIYLCGGSKLNVTGTLYCQGKIYAANYSSGYAQTYASATIGTEDGAVKLIQDSGSSTDFGVSAGGLSSSIDRITVERNKMPSEGYDPATANESDTRKGMSVYDGCSSNDMFQISLDFANPLEQASTKYIGQHYVNAMTRDLSSQYKDASGNMKPVSETSSSDSNIKYIYGSVKLTKSQVNSDDGSHVQKYLVRLTDQDIVIALPMCDAGTYTQPWDGKVVKTFNDNILAKFRIDRSGVPSGSNYFCYFMFYDPNDESKCYYLDSDTVVTSDEGVAMTLTGTTEAERSSKGIAFSRGNSQGISVADFSGIASSLGSGNLSDNFAANNPPYKLLESPCYIMYLVPDGVSFRVGNNGNPTFIHGIVYAVKSDVSMSPNASRIYGQVKCSTFTPPADTKVGIIQDCPIADGSLLGYVAEKNSSETSIKIQYYEY